MNSVSSLEQRLEHDLEVFEGLRDLPRIQELDVVPDREYVVSSMEGVLYPLIDRHQVFVVSGAFFGDEGKGKIVDAIARHPGIRIVMRANSGENAGHTVTIDGVDYIFHLMPSGILVPDKKCLIGSECAMDPVSFMDNEVGKLIDHNFSYKDRLFVGNTYITLPHHKLLDFLTKPPNASTLKGISEVHSSKVRKRGIRMDHIFGPRDGMVRRLGKELRTYMEFLHYEGADDGDVIARCAEMNTPSLKRFPEHVINFAKAGKTIDQKVDFLLALYDAVVKDNNLFPQRADTRFMFRQGLREGQKALLECAQSYVLGNENEIHWSSSTSASTSSAGTVASAAYNQSKHPTVTINIGKVPPSRVGLGSNPIGVVPQTWFSDQGIDTLDRLTGKCEDTARIESLYFSSIQDNGLFRPAVFRDKDGSELLVNEALAITWSRKFGEKGATTQKPRVLGFFDCVMHYEVNDVQGPYLSISAMDRLDDCEKVAVVVGYAYHDEKVVAMESKGRLYRNGDIICPGDQLPSEQVLQYCHPIMKVMDGWKGDPIAHDKRDHEAPLPEQLQRFIATIEHFTGAEVIAVGNGKENDHLIYIKRASIDPDMQSYR